MLTKQTRYIVTVQVYLLGLLLLLIGQWLISSCATVGSPSGGEKDTLPPELVYSIPANGSLQYKGREIKLGFNEYINTSKLKKELLITPFFDGNYEVKTKGREVIITFDKSLKDSITYTLNFRKGITDITEKNPLVNTNLVFSTGSFLDSMKIRGRVYESYTEKSISNSLVLLYDVADTLQFPENNPTYLTVTDKDGNYEFKNVKNSSYKLYTLNGIKEKISYKSKDQYIGYSAEIILLDTIDTLNIISQQYDIDMFKIKKSKSKNQYFDIITNKGIKNVEIHSLNTDIIDTVTFTFNNDKIRIYNARKIHIDSCPIQLQITDSSNYIISDTLQLMLSLKKKKLKEKFKLHKNIFKIKPSEKNALLLTFNKPIGQINTDSLLIYTTTDTLPYSEEINLLSNTKFVLDTLENLECNFHLKKGSFISIENDTLPEVIVSVKIMDPKKFGSIGGVIMTETSSFIVQILNSKNDIEAQSYGTKNFRFDFLTPGEKRIRILTDRNQNNKWDKGSFINQTPPEPVYFYNKEINLKANWEMLDYKIILPD